MSRGLFFRLSDDEVGPLLNFLGSGEELVQFVSELEEQYWNFACEVDKAWDPIHCSLNPFEEDEPLGAKGVVSGARCLLDDVQLGWITHLDPAQVKEVHTFLDGLNNEQFTRAYNAMPTDLRNPEYGPQECASALGWLEKLRAFYGLAAQESQHVIFSVAF
ncbi:DUF1877 family protein [Corynebacterium felinum]|uniref:DUF1877 family protein n=1 Tax=Corynebacterium felinum TaxID=131318 RepID=A0ABU2BC71_9CORY|nr:DUF1877 family protein [Corynebacterium felinum]MDF5820049.1 DUF1877 family protein [Corynebacterium felinum]MDR7356237.1 hypothetical protein [Corynebacterium felinum]WJY95569.1 hypothetical protein CFELI_09835 [Corynebacterium felinum]